ncbi:hypothetical protein [Natrinema marinum]|uniref:hypothetical protein n=1 Tax=Natrinema marinum TaxID=2961598 RepID=UPI0020C8EA02|nr:hypothetical protein [Natrinema marinum]
MRSTLPPEERAIRLLGALIVVLGVALLVNVAWGVVQVGTETYRHSATPVTPGDDALFSERTPDRIAGIDCFDEFERDWLCGLERSLLATHSDGELLTLPADDVTRGQSARFAYHDGTFYHRHERENTLVLDPVDERTVFAELAVDPGSLSKPERRALDGSVTSDRPLSGGGTVVAVDDGYVVLTSERVETGSPFVRGVSALGQFLLGLGLVARGWGSVRAPQIST